MGTAHNQPGKVVSPYLDLNEARKHWGLLNHSAYGCTEIVLIDDNDKLLIGFFDDVELLIAALEPHADKHVYAGNNPRPTLWTDNEFKQRSRASDSDIEMVSSVVLDIDPRNREKRRLGSEEDHRSALDAADQIAADYQAAVVDSGGGAYVWLALEPRPVEKLGGAEQFKAKVREWQRRLEQQYHLPTRRLKIDATHDLVHIFRLAGTYNHKGNGRPCRTISVPAELAVSALEEILAIEAREGASTEQIVLYTDALPPRFEKSLARDRNLRQLYEEPSSDGDQSKRDYALACRCLEKGLTQGETAAVLWRAPQGKRRRDNRKAEYVRATVARAAEVTAERVAQAKARQFHRTDTGNSERLVAYHGEDIRYCWPWTKWLTWDGGVWRIGDDAGVMQRAKQTVRAMYAEAANIQDDKQREALVDHARRSESAARLQAMVKLTQSESGIPVDPEDLDSELWLLNCLNCTVELRTGRPREHRREDLCTKMMPVEFDRAAECLRWEAFLERIFGGNRDMIEFTQRAIGYSLTGDVSEDALFFLHGSGANGKTTMLRTFLHLSGDYGRQTNPELLLTRRGEAHPTEIANLFGARFVSCVEVEEGRQMAESLVKWLTGGDKLTARRMREDFWQFNPAHKIWLGANNKPRVRGQDYAIWRRVKLIPFAVTIPEEDQDKHLGEKLRAELPGILNWALEGCLSWQQIGLAEPNEVRAATAEYKKEEDVLGPFIEDCCETNSKAQVKFADLYGAYTTWCAANQEKPVSGNALGRLLTNRGLEKTKTGGIALRTGLSLKDGV